MNTPLETPLGKLNGRDAIYLDRITQAEQSLELDGEVNGALCDDQSYSDKWVRYRLRFAGVRAYEVREIDSCRWPSESSFDEVRGSEWLRALGLAGSVRHFIVWTYDFALQVAATEVEFEIVGERSA